MKETFNRKKNMNLFVALFLLLYTILYSQNNPGKFIYIEWEKNPLASEYHVQISDNKSFSKILYQTKSKDSTVRLDPNPNYLYGRIAGVDEFGVRGEYSETFEIEQRIMEDKPVIPEIALASNYLGENHTITLIEVEQSSTYKNTYYKINEGKWATYHDGIHLSKEGINVIQYYSIDQLGNKEHIKTMEYILDTEGPIIDVTILNAYTDKDKTIYTGKNSKIQVFVKDIFSGVRSIKTYLRTIDEFKEIDGDFKNGVSIPKSFSSKIVELKIIATDRLGNIKTYSKFFKHDLAAPEVSIDSNYKIMNSSKKVSINTLSAYDSYSGVKNIFYSINDFPSEIYKEPILFSEPGEYELKIQAMDNVGNLSAFQYERIYISNPLKGKSIDTNKK